MAISIGKAAPKFSLPDSTGTPWKLKDAAGKNLVIYFYPRDNTPGCTREGSDFAELLAAFKKANTQVIGISADSVESHCKFKSKMKYPFELLSDVEHEICALFDVYKQKSLYGRKFMGIERSTFLIDAKGIVRQEWRKVKVPNHAAEVLKAAQQL
jgi:thioredoxin-dependent peroxiredoxin